MRRTELRAPRPWCARVRAGIAVVVVVLGVAGCTARPHGCGSEKCGPPPYPATSMTVSSPALTGALPPASSGSVSPASGRDAVDSSGVDGASVWKIAAGRLSVSWHTGPWTVILLPAGVRAPMIAAVAIDPGGWVWIAVDHQSATATEGTVDVYRRTPHGQWSRTSLTPTWPAGAIMTGSAHTITLTSAGHGLLGVRVGRQFSSSTALQDFFTSTDDGATFRGGPSVGLGPVWSQTILSATRQLVVFGANPDGIARTDDAGATWHTARITGLPPRRLLGLSTVTAVGGGDLEVMASEGHPDSAADPDPAVALLISRDDGATFTPQGMRLRPRYSTSDYLGGGYADGAWWYLDAYTIKKTTVTAPAWTTTPSTGLLDPYPMYVISSSTAVAVTTDPNCEGPFTCTLSDLIATTDGGLTWHSF